jgi:uncharacterized protein YecE (DUF72 family)
MRLIAGASGYSYKEWQGSFYPEKIKPDAMLAWYAERLPTVEINNTFYQMPKTAVLETWANSTPDAFRFAVKASRRITHEAQHGSNRKTPPSPSRSFTGISRRLAPSAGRCCFSCRRS